MRRHRHRYLTGRRRNDAGTVTAFVVVLVTGLLAAAGLVLDAGLALSTKAEAIDTAQAAARAGADQLDLGVYRSQHVLRLDPVRARAAAYGWLARAGATGEVTATPSAVTVTVHASRRTQLLQLVGVRQLDVTGTARAVAVRGVSSVDQQT
jgi:Flp pilus assembly protein TadG